MPCNRMRKSGLFFSRHASVSRLQGVGPIRSSWVTFQASQLAITALNQNRPPSPWLFLISSWLNWLLLRVVHPVIARARCWNSSWFPFIQRSQRFHAIFFHLHYLSLPQATYASIWEQQCQCTLSWQLSLSFNTSLFRLIPYLHLYQVVQSTKTTAKLYPLIDWTEDKNISILTCTSGSIARVFNLGRSSRVLFPIMQDGHDMLSRIADLPVQNAW